MRRIFAIRRRPTPTETIAIVLVLVIVGAGFLGFRTWKLTNERDELRTQKAALQLSVREGLGREADLRKRLDEKTTELAQLSTSTEGKDVVIRDLQAQTADRQRQIDELTVQRDSLKGCLDGVTLALLQLTNGGNAQAQGTVDGIRDSCARAQVLL